jgi:hypothetical protein
MRSMFANTIRILFLVRKARKHFNRVNARTHASAAAANRRLANAAAANTTRPSKRRLGSTTTHHLDVSMRSCCSAAARGAFCRVRRVRILDFPPCHAMPFSPGSYWPIRSYRYTVAMWSVTIQKCSEVPHAGKVGGRVHFCIHDIVYNRLSPTFARGPRPGDAQSAQTWQSATYPVHTLQTLHVT